MSREFPSASVRVSVIPNCASILPVLAAAFSLFHSTRASEGSEGGGFPLLASLPSAVGRPEKPLDNGIAIMLPCAAAAAVGDETDLSRDRVPGGGILPRRDVSATLLEWCDTRTVNRQNQFEREAVFEPI